MITTADYLFAETVYVAFRSSSPDVETMLRVVGILIANNIDWEQLYVVTTDHCQ